MIQSFLGWDIDNMQNRHNERNEFYEERAAIIEYDGGVDRVEAERLAKLDTLDHFTDYTLRRVPG